MSIKCKASALKVLLKILNVLKLKIKKMWNLLLHPTVNNVLIFITLLVPNSVISSTVCLKGSFHQLLELVKQKVQLRVEAAAWNVCKYAQFRRQFIKVNTDYRNFCKKLALWLNRTSHYESVLWHWWDKMNDFPSAHSLFSYFSTYSWIIEFSAKDIEPLITTISRYSSTVKTISKRNSKSIITVSRMPIMKCYV